MSFDLRIHFVGLALFVPEGETQMHVLLPATSNHAHAGHGPIESHFARVLYDEAYEHPGRTQLSRKYQHIELEGRVLDLTGLAVAEPVIDTHLPDELPSMAKVAGPVDPRHVAGFPDAQVVTGRITMDSGALAFYGLGALFHLDDPINAQRMTVRTEWTVRGITSRKPVADGGWQVLPELTLTTADTTKKVAKIPELYPIGQTIHLLVFHAPAQEFPPHGEDFRIPQPSAGERADHFPAYYTVCQPLPLRASVQPIPEPADAALLVEVLGDVVSDNGAQTPGMTCVQAQGMLASPPPPPENEAVSAMAGPQRATARARKSISNRVV